MTDAGPVPETGAGPVFFRRRVFLIAAALLILLACIAIYLVTALQKFLTFPGAHPSVQRLAALDEARGESMWLDVDGDRVEAWFLPAAGAPPHSLLIHAHGNGELIDIQTKSVEPLRAAGVSVLLVEYPGYGRSGGSPSEESVTATFVAAYDRMKGDPRVDAGHIMGYGRSLGGGAVAQLAAHRPLAALVLESTFTSIARMVRDAGVPEWLVINDFDTSAVLAKYSGPVLVLHGTRDQTFPVEHGHALRAASPHSELHIEVCGHNDCPSQWELVLSFLARNGVLNEPVPGGAP
ncbi:MAG TPA: alpha/beta hydrolase [Steroidobacteraceae bacterium]